MNRIVATGMAVPPCVVDNHLLARCMTTSDEWIVQRTGIRERRVSPDTYFFDRDHAASQSPARRSASARSSGVSVSRRRARHPGRSLIAH